jgi:hypothetical protein
MTAVTRFIAHRQWSVQQLGWLCGHRVVDVEAFAFASTP